MQPHSHCSSATNLLLRYICNVGGLELGKAITNYQPPEVPQGGGQSNALHWCICHKCRLMPTDIENKCCRQRDYVTNSPAFANLVLDCAALDIAIVHRIDVFVGTADYSPANYRKVAYRQYVIWKFGYLGSTTHGVVPSCVTWAIRDKYPAPDGNYMGFKDY